MDKRKIEYELNKTLKEFSKNIIAFCQNYANAYVDDDPICSIQYLKKVLIISGGAIASLYLNEEVNDYDIYSRDENLIESVRDCVIKHINSSQHTNFRYSKKLNKFYRCLNLEKDIDNDEYENEEIEFYEVISVPEIIKRNMINRADIDDDEDDYNEDEIKGVIAGLLTKPFEPLYITVNAISFTQGYQLITRFFGEPEEILSNFDFIPVKNYFDFERGKLILNDNALNSLLTKTLYYDGTKFPICSIFRMKKYLLKGWKISTTEIFKMCYQISELDLKDIEILKEQLIGVSTTFFLKFLLKLNKIKYPSMNDIINIIDETYEDFKVETD